MIVDAEVSLAIIRKEIAECQTGNYGWSFSEIDEANLIFHVTMRGKDDEPYIIQIKFDDYKHKPLLLDFVDPVTKAVGVKTAYPKDSTGFFNPSSIAICHPCSRKAYASLHREWELSGWQNNPNVGALKSLRPILEAIYSRINNDKYDGRMEKRSA